MEWFLWALAVAVLGLAAVAGSGRFGSMPAVVRDSPVVQLPDGDLTGADLRGVQFAVVARGYSMAQVDELVGRVAAQLEWGRPDGGATVAPPPAASAIMEPSEFSQSGREGEHGSNEAPHG